MCVECMRESESVWVVTYRDKESRHHSEVPQFESNQNAL